MLSFRLALLLSILGALLVCELLVWILWRTVFHVFRRDLAPLRLLLLPALWAGDVLRISLGTADGDRDDGQRRLLERAVTARSLGDYDEAARLFQKAANRLSYRRDAQFLAEILLDRALCLEQLGDIEGAMRDWEHAASLMRDRESSFLQIRSAYCRGLIERRRGETDAAIEWLERARAAARDTASQRIPAVSGMTDSLIALYRQQGRLDQAIQLCQVATNEWGWSGNKYKQADVLCELADLQAEQGNLDASLRTLRQIKTMAEVLHYQAALDRVDASMRRYHTAAEGGAAPLRVVAPEESESEPSDEAQSAAEPEEAPKVIRFPRRGR